MKQPIVIVFSSGKGGAGKTTLTQLVATYLFTQQLKIMVVDADYPQHSFSRSRLRDLNPTPDHPNLLAALAERGITPYPIETMKMDELIRVLPHLRTSTLYDLIFLDLPGTLNVDNFHVLAGLIDLVVVPFELEFKSYVAGMDTVDFYQNYNPDLPVAAIWTKLKTPHKVNFRKSLENTMEEKGVHVFSAFLKETVQIGDQISTIFPLKHFVGKIVEELMNMEPMKSLQREPISPAQPIDTSESVALAS